MTTLSLDLTATYNAIITACSSWSYSIAITGTDYWKPSGGETAETYTFNLTLSK